MITFSCSRYLLILQRYYNLSDEPVESQINDRMSFMRFLGLSIADDIPDSKTVWHFREQLTDLDLGKRNSRDDNKRAQKDVDALLLPAMVNSESLSCSK